MSSAFASASASASLSATQLPHVDADNPAMFNFHRLDVYRCAITFLSLAVPLAERAPRGFSSLSDQLRRAALSIPLSVAEGGGKFGKEERRYFGIARGSALECAAIVDALEALGGAAATELAQPRELLERIVSILTRMWHE